MGRITIKLRFSDLGLMSLKCVTLGLVSFGLVLLGLGFVTVFGTRVERIKILGLGLRWLKFVTNKSNQQILSRWSLSLQTTNPWSQNPEFKFKLEFKIFGFITFGNLMGFHYCDSIRYFTKLTLMILEWTVIFSTNCSGSSRGRL